MFRRLCSAIVELTTELRLWRLQDERDMIEPHRLRAITDKLKASNRRLAKVVAAYQPKISA